MKTDRKCDWLDDPQNIRKVRMIFYMLLALTVLPDFFLHKHTLFYHVEAWPGFYAAGGFLSCAVIIVVSKLLGFLLKREEDYYD
jgi:hypothetical protein